MPARSPGMLASFAMAATMAVAACAAAADDEVARARGEYQAAMIAGDLPAARGAMLRAVQAKDDDAGLWVDLGRAQLGLGDVSGAYYAYSRATELDRTNVEALQILADVSVLARKPREAERYADQILLLQPDAPGPLLTKGFVDLARNRPDDAARKADAVLAMRPFDAGASILKARALSANGRFAEAAELLEAQVAAKGPDKNVLSTTLGLYRRGGDGPAVLRTLARLAAIDPANPERALDHAAELYRAGDAGAARAIATRLADASPPPERLGRILSLWSAHEDREQAARNVEASAGRASPAARVQYADFLVRAGRPARAQDILRDQAGLPISSANADAVAVFAAARAGRGDVRGALPMLDAVLRFDPGNDLALRARVDLDLAAGRSDRTLADARKLTIANPQSASDRIRLARCYALRGNRSLAETTYWTAFSEIPGDALLYETFRTFLAKSNRPEAVARLTRRYAEQKRDLAAALLAKG